ncbi:LOW QUALITY PROTEIN: inositol-trisphosphate 3-kinase homolog [Drosophila eugracilis]|uniref:LOW QUALITY PROTEIN: inositol-trisphosphate 3-kinase homolog n=1 Tax=Drosophila eugracilis TaxID=29029 RepID=UPI001BDA546A|nr:LOW QUALITY PROTEIN: inositol-trisphosphate 3-kinase homolog [Drosophila eugracilis]
MTMTSTVLQRPIQAKAEKKASKSANSTRSRSTMAWSNEKLRFSCIDNIGLKQLWKLIALDTSASSKQRNAMMLDVEQQQQQQQQQQSNNNNERIPNENCDNLADYLSHQRAAQAQKNHIQSQAPAQMSLLKFLAINALELSAPATPHLLQHQQTQTQAKPQGWMQLSGHPESIVPTSTGIVRKRISGFEDSEVKAYRLICQEPQTAQIVPAYFGIQEVQAQQYIELQDLLAGFRDPCVMDIKMGSRTFLESEVSNATLRPDLYQKMIAVDAGAPTPAEHEARAITKLRYMTFRESLSSSHSKGFRIEALRLRGRPPVKDLKTCRTSDQIAQTIEQFLAARRSVQKELLKRLKHMRLVIEQSSFFARHEIVGSSIFIVYDDDRVGVWLIDFAKCRELPPHIRVDHRSAWTPGNREEGLLRGMDELIRSFEEVYARCGSHRSCLKI